MKVLPNVLYSGNESGLTHFRVGQLVPSNGKDTDPVTELIGWAALGSLPIINQFPEKSKDFWVYDGSETIEPYREVVKWIAFRSAIPISSAQVTKTTDTLLMMVKCTNVIASSWRVFVNSTKAEQRTRWKNEWLPSVPSRR